MAETKVLLLTVVLCFGVVTLLSSVEGDVSYGGPCNSSDPALVCDVQQGTVCKEKENSTETVCRCQDKHYYWSREAQSCAALVNEQAVCNPISFDGTPAIPCTENARCLKNTTGIYRCVCASSYSPDTVGLCKPSFGAPCRAEQDECNFDKYLSCSSGNNTCACRATEMEYFQDKGCVVKIGGNCSPIDSMDRPPCIDSGKSACNETENVCKCNELYEPSPDMARCVVYHNRTCTADSDCADTLKCVDTNVTSRVVMPRDDFADFEDEPVGPRADGKLCLCEPGKEVWNVKDFRCEILAGSNCSTVEPNRCVQNAQCEANVCKCVSGTKADGGTCKGELDFACSAEEDCLKSDYLTCSSDKKCACDASHPTSYNGICVGGTGSPCTSDANCERVTSMCGTGNTCGCRAGYSQDSNKNRACFANRGTACTATADCYSPAILACVASKCDCESTEEWEGEKCNIGASESCENPRDNIPCIANSTCGKDENNEMKCKCDSGFKVDQDKKRCASGAGAFKVFSIFLILPVYVILKSF